MASDEASQTLRLSYPPSDKPVEQLTHHEKLMKIGRNIPCNTCSCKGWRPKPPGPGRADSCACGHKLSSHGGQCSSEEFERRLRVAIRIDELLEEMEKLLDFDYEDEDIRSLRKQMILQDGTPSPHKSPSLKRSREGSVEDGEGDEPISKRVKLEGETNGVASVEDGDQEPKDKITNGAEVSELSKKEKEAVLEERAGIVEFRVVANDGTRDSMIFLTGLKNIFQKQLPKMPKEYIARLVYDRNHVSMAIVKRDMSVVGGITYRPFYSQKFAEIVFCAIASQEQVRGYGSRLMNHLKDYIRSVSDIQHFLTYADNYATGYFEKQGFTKEITLDRSMWVGYIKDYEGGTLMQCSMVPKVQYLRVREILAIQKEVVYEKIKTRSTSHIVYPGLVEFREGSKEVDPMTVRGIKESGWTPEMDTAPNQIPRSEHYTTMRQLVSELQNHNSSWPFLQPVNKDDVADYYEVIKDPMDLATLESKVEADMYKTLDDFQVDVQKIFDNCRTYNAEGTPYYKCANRLEKYFKDRLKYWLEQT
ncbi:uncharacterized protein VTP21DRAFT_1419 [Calcarisporiella thermophila]|uniref:uncharacterized protein n=1 Tax=Calcarisporiella thermophila TaxID=911321 RepID=UPI003743D563